MANAIAGSALTKLYPRENLSFGQFTLTEAKSSLLYGIRNVTKCPRPSLHNGTSL